jgi:uracil-DNA glycosylase
LQELFLVTYHPAAVLRNRNLMDEFVSDLKKASKAAKSSL